MLQDDPELEAIRQKRLAEMRGGAAGGGAQFVCIYINFSGAL